MAEVSKIQIEVDARDADKATRSLNNMGTAAGRAGRKVKGYEDKAERAQRKTKTFSTAIMRTRAAFGALGIAVSGLTLGALARQIERATTQLNNIEATLRVATGSAEDAANSMAFLRDESERLGLFLPAVAKQYGQFAAAAKSADISTQELRATFTGVAEASRAMGLTIPETEGAMKALQQMMSKGKISAEELRQQLGERLPGSIQIMAQSLDITTTKLFEMMENGELLSDEVLPKFGRQLQMTFGGEAAAQADKIAASIARLKTAFFDLMAQDTGLQGASNAINDLAKVVASPDFEKTFSALVKNVSDLMSLIAANLDKLATFGKLLAGFAFLKASQGALNLSVSMTRMAGAFAVANGASKSLILSLRSLRIALAAVAKSPLGWVLVGVGSLASLSQAFSSAKESALDSYDAFKQGNKVMENMTANEKALTEAIRERKREELSGDFQEYLDISEEIADRQRRISEFMSGDREFVNLQSQRYRIEQLKEERFALLGNVSAYIDLTRRIEDLQTTISENQDASGSSGLAAVLLEQQKEAEKAANAAKEYAEELVDLGLSQENAAALAEIYAEKSDRVKESLEGQLEAVRELNRNDLLPPGMRSLSVEGQQERIDILSDRRSEEERKAAEREEERLEEARRRAEQFVNSSPDIDQMPPRMRNLQAVVSGSSDALDDFNNEALSSAELLEKVIKTGERGEPLFNGWQKSLDSVNSALKDNLSDSLTDVLMDVESLSDAFSALADQIARTVMQQTVADPLSNAITGGIGDILSGGFGGGTTPTGGAPVDVRGIGPARANGGNVYGDKAHIVGERGPELFVPGQDGRIMPNSQMGGSGDVTVNIINQGGEQMEAQKQDQRRGPNGEMTVDVMVKSSMERLDSQGQLDGIFRRHGAKRQGQF